MFGIISPIQSKIVNNLPFRRSQNKFGIILPMQSKIASNLFCMGSRNKFGLFPPVQSKIASLISLMFNSQRRRYNVSCPARLANRKPIPALHTGSRLFFTGFTDFASDVFAFVFNTFSFVYFRWSL